MGLWEKVVILNVRYWSTSADAFAAREITSPVMVDRTRFLSFMVIVVIS
jgi:hypothetical protein